MKVFEIVKTVLDEEYENIFPEAKRDAKINNALTELGTAYNRVENRGGPDLSDPAVRFAYIYRYTTAHANIVFETIANRAGLGDLFDHDSIKIACIGGGPGSDLLGIYKYVLLTHQAVSMMFYLLGKEDAWAESWSEVNSMTRSALSSSTMFRHIDVCDESSWRVHKKLLNSDLLTFVYFFSEIFHRRTEAAPFFDNLFRNAKKGARFLYIGASCRTP